MRRTILFGFLVLLLSRTSSAQSTPDVATILKSVSETYKGVKEYQFTIDSFGSDPSRPTHKLFSFRLGQYRLDAAPSESSDVGLTIFDGATLWYYFPKLNEYAAFSLNSLANGAVDSGYPWKPSEMDELMLWPLRHAADSADRAKFVRQDILELGGTKIDCYVVSVAIDKDSAPSTWWIEKTRSHVVRMENEGGGYTVLTIMDNERLPDDLFRFIPPRGARKQGN
jgi:outer membrane lipoprotein-sorting protein